MKAHRWLHPPPPNPSFAGRHPENVMLNPNVSEGQPGVLPLRLGCLGCSALRPCVVCANLQHAVVHKKADLASKPPSGQRMRAWCHAEPARGRAKGAGSPVEMQQDDGCTRLSPHVACKASPKHPPQLLETHRGGRPVRKAGSVPSWRALPLSVVGWETEGSACSGCAAASSSADTAPVSPAGTEREGSSPGWSKSLGNH